MKAPHEIKKAQKESVFFRIISELFLQAREDFPILEKVTITHAALSRDKGLCNIYFYIQEVSLRREAGGILEAYKPSFRKALAAKIDGRYVPELAFRFDSAYEKHQKIEALFEKIAHQS